MKGEREARERSIANTQRIRDLNRASEAAFEEGVELAEMGSQPAPSPDVAQARESALVRAERERLQRAFPLVPTASPVRLPDGGPHGPTFLAGDHLPRPGQVIEDPSTGQPASDPAAQRPGDDGDKPLRDTVRDHEIQPLSEGGKMAANFLATQGGGDIQFAGLDIISREDDSRSELQKDEALWRREGDVLTAAFALDRTSLEIKAAEKRLANTKGKLDAVTDLNRGNEGPLAVNLMAKAQRDFDRAKANYDGAQAAHASLKKETEAAGILITPAHMKYVEDRRALPETFLFFFPLGTRSHNLFRNARLPDSDGGIDITPGEAKVISRAQIGDVFARAGTASTFIGGPGLVFNAGKGILRGGAISKPLLGKILKEAPTEALEEAGFQTSDILFYREQFDLPGFAGEVAVESFLQAAGTFAPGRRVSGGGPALVPTPAPPN